MTLSLSQSLEIQPDDFEPPLKRKQALVPYYWTVEELAEELGASIRKVQFDITGNEKLRVRAKLKAIKVGPIFLIPERDAMQYIQQQRQAKLKINKT
jgi:hypothetical protein